MGRARGRISVPALAAAHGGRRAARFAAAAGAPRDRADPCAVPRPRRGPYVIAARLQRAARLHRTARSPRLHRSPRFPPSDRFRRTRRLTTGVAVTAVPALALALIAGCASVPSGGQVASGRTAEPAEPFDDPYVRIVPVRPRQDWLPEDILSGFLTASASFDDRHR